MSKPKVKPLSRSVRTKLVKDLAQRLQDHSYVAEAILKAEKPCGNHTVLEHNVRTVFGLLLESQLKRLREIEGLARMLAERA